MSTILALRDVVSRSQPPAPWDEGDNIPWDDPEFSGRMLHEHLTQEHDLASRRSPQIAAHVQWLHLSVLEQQPGRILDLGCGPGLYLHGLCRRGHAGVGIDFSPASVEHARAAAVDEGLDSEVIHGDLRDAPLGGGFDLALLIYGQINVFRREQARDILARTSSALERRGGRLVLEPQAFAAVRGAGQTTATWSTAESGLFSSRPHMLLHETFWDEASRTRTERWHVVDAETAEVQRFAMSCVAWEEGELVSLLRDVGFSTVEMVPGLTGPAAPSGEPLYVLVARR